MSDDLKAPFARLNKAARVFIETDDALDAALDAGRAIDEYDARIFDRADALKVLVAALPPYRPRAALDESTLAALARRLYEDRRARRGLASDDLAAFDALDEREREDLRADVLAVLGDKTADFARSIA